MFIVVASRDDPLNRAEHLAMRGDVGVGDLGLRLDARHTDVAQPHGVEVPHKEDNVQRGGWGLLPKPPPPVPAPPPLALLTPGEGKGLRLLI